MQKFVAIGRLTRDPELTQISNGASICKFTLAVGRRFKKDETDFFNIVAWRELGETCAKYLKKGNQAAVVGTIQCRSYTDKEGIKRQTFDVIADEVDFLTKNSNEETTPTTSEETHTIVTENAPIVPPAAQKTLAQVFTPDDDGLPF